MITRSITPDRIPAPSAVRQQLLAALRRVDLLRRLLRLAERAEQYRELERRPQ